MELIISIMKFTGIRMILKYVIVLFTANAWYIFRDGDERDTFYIFADHANWDQRLTVQRWRKIFVINSRARAPRFKLRVCLMASRRAIYFPCNP